MALYLDAMSVFTSLTAVFQKTPADKSVPVHCLYLRQLLNDAVLRAIAWVDTRDMHADGCTKGSIDRDALRAIMDGKVSMDQEGKIFTPKGKASLGGLAGDGGE